MFDLNNKKSFEALDKWKKDALDKVQCSDPSKFPFVLVGNKSDLEHVVPMEEV